MPNTISENNIQRFNPTNIEDLTPILVDRKFGRPEDFIEIFIMDLAGNILNHIPEYEDYIIPQTNPFGALTNELDIDAETVLKSLGYATGKYKLHVNIQKRKIFNEVSPPFRIKEISADRTEIKLYSIFGNTVLDSNSRKFISDIQTSPYFRDFTLKFSNNVNLLGINIEIDKTSDPNQFFLLVKLFQPLPGNIVSNTSLHIVEDIVDPVEITYDLGFPPLIETGVPIKGPNFKIDTRLNSKIPKAYKSYDDILTTNTTSSYQKLLSKLDGYEIPEIDYSYIRPVPTASLDFLSVTPSHFENFVHFGSATERVKNFKYKLQLIEIYDKQLAEIRTITGDTSQSSAVLGATSSIEIKKENLIQGFDGYEQFLYFDSGAYSWPKTNSIEPYLLESTTSSIANAWIGSSNVDDIHYGGQLLSASIFDKQNPNRLFKMIPTFIGDNLDNQPVELFCDMLGQHFDPIWAHIKEITQIRDNSHKLGISKELVYYALEGLGIEAYDQFENEDLIDYIFGTPFTTKDTATVITASNEIFSKQDITQEIWKRLYHNAPYLLKTKGTERGLRALINCYGIPDTILDIKEYGSSHPDRDEFKLYTYNKFMKVLSGHSRDASGFFINTDWSSSLTNNLGAAADSKHIEFRIKPTRAEESYHLLTLSSSRANSNVSSSDLHLLLEPYISGSELIHNPLFLNPVTVLGNEGFPGYNKLDVDNEATFTQPAPNTIRVEMTADANAAGNNYGWNVRLQETRIHSKLQLGKKYKLSVEVKTNVSNILRFGISTSNSQNKQGNYHNGSSTFNENTFTKYEDVFTLTYLDNNNFTIDTQPGVNDGNIMFQAFIHASIGGGASAFSTGDFFEFRNLSVIEVNPNNDGLDFFAPNDKKQYGRLNLHQYTSSIATTPYFPIYNGEFWTVNLGVKGRSGSANGESNVANTTCSFGAYNANYLREVDFYTSSVLLSEKAVGETFGNYHYGLVSSSLEGGASEVHIGGIKNIFNPNANIAANAFTSSNYTVTYTGSAFDLDYSGSLSEVRFYFGELLTHDTLKLHALEPLMYAGNTTTSSFDSLVVRYPLSFELDLNHQTSSQLPSSSAVWNQSPTPDGLQSPVSPLVGPITGGAILSSSLNVNQTSSATTTYTGQPFGSGSVPLGSAGAPVFTIAGTPLLQSHHPNEKVSFLDGFTFFNDTDVELLEEEHHLPTPNTIGKSPINRKIRIDSGSTDDDILSPDILSQLPSTNRQVPDFDSIGVFLSPQNEMNEDIIYTIGTFSLDEFLGDPRDQISGSYPQIENIKNHYFKKLERGRQRQNIFDYTRWIQYVDHTLFELIKQFTPQKSTVKTGLLIEPHYLERSKFQRFHPSASNFTYDTTIQEVTQSFSKNNNFSQVDNTTGSVVLSQYNFAGTGSDGRELQLNRNFSIAIDKQFTGSSAMEHGPIESVVNYASNFELDTSTGGEMIKNGSFEGIADGTDPVSASLNTGPWAAYGSPTTRLIVNEQLVISNDTSSQNRGIRFYAPTIVGRTYRLQLNAFGDIGSVFINNIVGTQFGSTVIQGEKILTFIADSTLVNIFFRANKNQASAGSTTFDNISLKEVKHDFTVTSNATTTINTSNSNGYNNSSFSGNPLTGKFDLKVQTSGGDGGIVSRPFLFKAGRKYKVSFNYRIASGTKMRYKIANSPSSTTGANIKGLGYSPNDNLNSTSKELFEQEFIFSHGRDASGNKTNLNNESDPRSGILNYLTLFAEDGTTFHVDDIVVKEVNPPIVRNSFKLNLSGSNQLRPWTGTARNNFINSKVSNRLSKALEAPEIINNGSYIVDDSNSDWQLGFGGTANLWSISNGKLVANDAASNHGIRLQIKGPNRIRQNRAYRLSFTITDYESGEVRGVLYSEQNRNYTVTPQVSANGTYTFDITVNKNQQGSFSSTLFFQARGTSTTKLKVGNISLKQINPKEKIEFDDSLLDMQSWNLPRYKGSKLTGAKINEFTPGDITYGLNPVISQNVSAIFFGKSLIGADGEDDSLVTIKNHSYIDIEKILIINKHSDKITELDLKNENYKGINGYVASAFKDGASFNIELLDDKITHKLKDTYKAKFSQGYLYKILEHKGHDGSGNIHGEGIQVGYLDVASGSPYATSTSQNVLCYGNDGATINSSTIVLKENTLTKKIWPQNQTFGRVDFITSSANNHYYSSWDNLGAFINSMLIPVASESQHRLFGTVNLGQPINVADYTTGSNAGIKNISTFEFDLEAYVVTSSIHDQISGSTNMSGFGKALVRPDHLLIPIMRGPHDVITDKKAGAHPAWPGDGGNTGGSHSGATDVQLQFYFSGDVNIGSAIYQISYLEETNAIIADVDKSIELANDVGDKGYILIPDNLDKDIKDNLDFFLNQAGYKEGKVPERIPNRKE